MRYSKWSIVEWTYEGGLKCYAGNRVDADGSPSVINGVHMLVCRESGCNASIWVVPQKQIMAFVPCRGQEPFFM